LNIEANEPSLNYGLQVSFFSQLTHVSNVAAAAEKKCPFVGLCFFFPMAFVGERREREREREREQESERARERERIDPITRGIYGQIGGMGKDRSKEEVQLRLFSRIVIRIPKYSFP
jgi:hypothetical protein